MVQPLTKWRQARQLSNPVQDTSDYLQTDSADLISQVTLLSRSVSVSSPRVLLRLIRLLSFAALYLAGRLWRRLTTVSASERQRINAAKFRELLERLGGAMIKAGQQMSQRADIFAPVYCEELKKLLNVISTKIDDVDVRETIETQIKRSMEEIFSEFSFDPVGSASVSCVYRAALRSGEQVAVKVRRPNIQKDFAADLTALDWILRLAEFMTIWRPGMSDNLRNELKGSLLEELDFRTEARYQELFRRYNKRRRKLNVTAPKVYYELSGEAVMVSEFVTGFWAKDIITALEQGDELYIARLRANGIDPKTVAKRLIRSQYYSFHECPLFHGDPHPGNVLVQPGNRIVMVDFGACGVFSERDRNLVWHMNHYYSRDNVAGMVNMVISIMEPIPHRDIEAFRKELTDAWWQGFYGIKSKHAEAWERTSFRLWLRFLQLIRKYSIPIPRNMVRMIRATLMYDTVAASLYSKINVFREFELYSEDVARRVRYRIEESAIRQLFLGPSNSTFLKLQQIANVGNGILYRVQKFLDEPEFGLLAMAGKLYYAFQMVVKMFFSFGATTLSAYATAVVFKRGFLTGSDLINIWNLDPKWALRTIAVFWGLSLLGLFFTYGRKVMWRFGDVDN